MGSTRLPAKIMLPVNGNPIFQSGINRLKQIGCPIYIATTQQPADTTIVNFSLRNNIPCYRGDENNVLSRYYECAKAYKLDVIVRVTSDCPLIDAELIKEFLNSYLEKADGNLYLSNTLTRTYPRGYDFEIFSFGLLEDAFLNAVNPVDLEHVTPYINANKSGKAHIEQLTRPQDASKFRLTLDTPEDFTLLKRLIEQYGADSLTGEEIILLMQQYPDLAKINESVEQKSN